MGKMQLKRRNYVANRKNSSSRRVARIFEQYCEYSELENCRIAEKAEFLEINLIEFPKNP